MNLYLKIFNFNVQFSCKGWIFITVIIFHLIEVFYVYSNISTQWWIFITAMIYFTVTILILVMIFIFLKLIEFWSNELLSRHKYSSNKWISNQYIIVNFNYVTNGNLLSQPNNNHNPNNKTTIIVVGLRLSNRWEFLT